MEFSDLNIQAKHRPKNCDDWHSHWQNFAEGTRFNPAQRYRRKLIFSRLDFSDPNSDQILDIGSGLGDFALEIRRVSPSASILGIELSQSGIDISRRKVPNAHFLKRDLLVPQEAPPQYSGWATQAVCSEVLEHLDQPIALLRNIKPFLAANCRLVITVPGGPRTFLDKYIGHRRHYSPAELKTLVESAGFEVAEVSGAGFPFFNLYKFVCVLRGKRLVRDAAVSLSTPKGWFSRFVMGIFGVLFQFNAHRGGWGWQTICVARSK